MKKVDEFIQMYAPDLTLVMQRRMPISSDNVRLLMSEYAIDVITDYTDFLVKNGYCDSDVYSEPPSAIDRFMHPELNEL